MGVEELTSYEVCHGCDQSVLPVFESMPQTWSPPMTIRWSVPPTSARMGAACTPRPCASDFQTRLPVFLSTATATAPPWPECTKTRLPTTSGLEPTPHDRFVELV